MDHKSIWILTETSARARLEPCRAVHPPANRVRPTQPRPLYPATNQAARAMRKAHYARKQVACALARPTEYPSAPAIREQKDQASDSTSNAAPATHPENVIDRHRQTERRSARPTHWTDRRTNPRENAAKYSAPCFSSRTILPHPSRPNAMLSRRRTIAVVSASR